MRRGFRTLVVAGALVVAGLGGAIPASATAVAPPSLVTTNFACANGVCEIGPGDVGLPFAAGVIGIGGPAYYGPECNAYTMSVVGGSLPPGLTFSEPDCEYIVSGTPTHAGTYAFAVRITPQPDSLGQIPGPSGTADLTVTVGTGTADRLAHTSASYNGHQGKLYVTGYDANIATLYSVSVTSSGKALFAPQSPSAAGFQGADGHWQLAAFMQDPCGRSSACSLTVTDSLGSTATITLPPATY